MIRQNWNSALYQSKHAFVYQYGEDLVELLDPKPHERILDLGSGSGELTDKIAKIAPMTVGLDRSRNMVERARAQFPQIDFRLGDAAHFDFEEKFDAIFSNATLHWVTESDAAIRAMNRALRPQGRLVLEFGGLGNVKTILDCLRKVLLQRGHPILAQHNPWYFPSIGAYASQLETEGFRVTWAQLYDRPTELADQETGIMDWLAMFAGSFFEGLDASETRSIMQSVQDALRPNCLHQGKWYADYVRIRIVAQKSMP